MIDVTGIDKAELLAALHNGTKALGLGKLQDLKRDITVEEARSDLVDNLRLLEYVDYYHGRPIKVTLSKDAIDAAMYDRDAGPGAFQRIVDKLRSEAAATT